MKDQIIDYAKSDIEYLLKEYDEMKKIVNLFDAIDTNFDKDGIDE
jgi:ribonuclease D